MRQYHRAQQNDGRRCVTLAIHRPAGFAAGKNYRESCGIRDQKLQISSVIVPFFSTPFAHSENRRVRVSFRKNVPAAPKGMFVIVLAKLQISAKVFFLGCVTRLWAYRAIHAT